MSFCEHAASPFRASRRARRGSRRVRRARSPSRPTAPACSSCAPVTAPTGLAACGRSTSTAARSSCSWTPPSWASATRSSPSRSGPAANVPARRPPGSSATRPTVMPRSPRSRCPAGCGPPTSPQARRASCLPSARCSTPAPTRPGRGWRTAGPGRSGPTHLETAEQRVLAEPDGPSPAEVTWGLAEFVAAEEMDRYRGYWWAPDGAALIAARVDESPVQRWHIADPANPDRPPVDVAYPAAGTANADVTLWVLGVEGGRTQVRWDADRYPYVVTVSWSSAGPPLLHVMSRDQRSAAVLGGRPCLRGDHGARRGRPTPSGSTSYRGCRPGCRTAAWCARRTATGPAACCSGTTRSRRPACRWHRSRPWTRPGCSWSEPTNPPSRTCGSSTRPARYDGSPGPAATTADRCGPQPCSSPARTCTSRRPASRCAATIG